MGRFRGFTLVEVLIVVIILGILAAIVIAMTGNASQDAKRVAAQAAVLEASQAITLYKEYTGQLPNLLGPSWDALTTQTTVGGATVGAFLHGPPQNPLAHGDPSCITDGDDPTLSINTCSFLYDYAGGNGTGRFIASLDP